MKSVILAAGKGTRMKDLTQEVPKPMLRVQDRPILEHIVAGLVAAGIQDICIITGWRGDVIEAHFGDGTPFGARISYARQEVQDGTGKAAEPARAFVGDDDFLLTYGDILVRPDTYKSMLERWDEGGFGGLITVTEGQDITKGGLNFFDNGFNLARLVEKPSPAQLDELRATGWLRPGQPVWYNAGIYVFQPVVFEYMARLERSPRGEFELTDAISSMVAHGRTVAGLRIEGRWVDVRDPEVLASLQA